jgi:hypothetical protein
VITQWPMLIFVIGLFHNTRCVSRGVASAKANARLTFISRRVTDFALDDKSARSRASG